MLLFSLWLGLATPSITQAYPCGYIRMTELHPDPSSLPDRQGEFIELHNPTSTIQRTVGWFINLNGVDLALPNISMGPHSTVTLSRGVWPLPIKHLVWDDLRLPNRKGKIQLLDRCKRVAQAVQWGAVSSNRIRTGRSLELIWRRGRLRWRASRRKDAVYGDRASPGRVSKRLSQRLAPKETRSRPVVSKPTDSRQRVRRKVD